jgi:AcrR family transcriptional regulator
VLAGAEAVFDRHGFDQATLDEVAAEAGLTKGAIYSSFGTKDELFAALMNAQIDERLRRVAGALQQQPPNANPAHAVASVMTAATRGDPGWHVTFLEYWVKAMRSPQLRRSLADQRRRARELIARSVHDHSAALGIELPLSDENFAVVLLALSNGLAIEQLLDPAAVDQSALEQTLAGLILSAARRGRSSQESL